MSKNRKCFFNIAAKYILLVLILSFATIDRTNSSNKVNLSNGCKHIAYIDESKITSEKETIEGKGYSVHINAKGSIQITIGKEKYNIGTSFSYPGTSINFNTLNISGIANKPNWHPVVSRGKGKSVNVSANCDYYSLERNISLDGHRVIVTDKLTNTTIEDVGIIYRNELSPDGEFTGSLLAGADQKNVSMTAENPSVFASQPNSSLAWLAEDEVQRLQLVLASKDNQVRMSVINFALPPGESYTFQWAVYPQPSNADYWTFINQARQDWDVNFQLIGSWAWMDLTSDMELFRNHEKLKAYFERKKVQVVAFAPWLDYDNFNYKTGKQATRAETKELMKEALIAVKKVNKDLICIGLMECNLVSLPEEVVQFIYQNNPETPHRGFFSFTDQQMKFLRQYDLRWKDCILQNKDGKYLYEFYYRGEGKQKTPLAAVGVFPSPGNDQHKYWLDQARFFLGEVGLDGLYIDQFNLAFNDRQRYSYHDWDGVTVDIDPSTGRITKKYTDAALVGTGARTDLVNYVFSKGSYMLANTFPAVPQMQSLRMHRFNESQWHLKPVEWEDGEMPPLKIQPCKGHLSTPIALGEQQGRIKGSPEDYTKYIMKLAIAYLRHGLLYYHYRTEIPESIGGYGAINYMFPITPVELHEGWIVGKERIISCRSGTYHWTGKQKPMVMVFDLQGLPVTPKAKITRSKGNTWKIKLDIKDWAEIAVIKNPTKK